MPNLRGTLHAGKHARTRRVISRGAHPTLAGWTLAALREATLRRGSNVSEARPTSAKRAVECPGSPRAAGRGPQQRRTGGPHREMSRRGCAAGLHGRRAAAGVGTHRAGTGGLAGSPGRTRRRIRVLPPWTRWWSRDDLAGVIPEDPFDDLDRDCPRLPLSYFDGRARSRHGRAGLGRPGRCPDKQLTGMP